MVTLAHVCYDGGVTGVGPVPADVMAIGIAPGRHEWQRTKQPFTGPSGQELNNFLKFIGMNRDDLYLTNVICWWKDDPDADDIERCLPRLLEELYEVKPKLILALGKIVTEFFLAQQLQTRYEMPKEPTFGTMRSGVFWARIGRWEGWVLPTYHPAAYLGHAGSTFKTDVADAVRDFRKIKDVLTWSPTHGKVDYRVAQGAREAETWLAHLEEHKGDLVCLDVETKYDNQGFLGFAYTCSHHTVHFGTAICGDINWHILDPFANEIIWGYWNGQFDRGKMRFYYGVDLPIGEDGMLISYSLDERGGGDLESDSGGQDRAVGIHGLKRNAREYCGAGFYDAKAKGRIDQLTPEELAYYNSCDAAYTYRLIKRGIPLQIEDGVREMYLNFLIPAANVLAEVTERGVRIDRKAMKELALEWLPRWLDTEKRLQEEARRFGWTGQMTNKKGKVTEIGDLNLGSPQQLSHFIYDICKVKEIPRQGRTTKMDVMKVFAKDEYLGEIAAWCNALLEWRGLDHDVNNYLITLEQLMDDEDCIHPEALQHGTRVGRWSYHNPPVQTIPKKRTVGADRARIRKVFRARPGHLFIEADYSQAELYAASMVSGDKQILADLRSGDFHSANVPMAFHVTKEGLIERLGEKGAKDEWDRLRDSTKIYTYGKLYGGGVGALTGDNRVGRGSGGNYEFMDMATAKELEKAWEARYHVYMAWREAEKKLVLREGEQVNVNGRKRRYYRVDDYRTLNQAINFPCSSLSHDHLVDSMIKLHYLLREFNAYVLFDVHDALLFETPKEYLEPVARLVKRVMEEPKFGLDYGIPVDIKCGRNWLDMDKLEVIS